VGDTDFDNFFAAATGYRRFEYQRRLAEGDGDACERSLLISVPTGMGKTAAVVLAWLWNRAGHPHSEHRDRWPRRLVYCLPMRTLVEQTRRNVADWLSRLAPKYLGPELQWLAANSPVVLMGGEEDDRCKAEWDLYPEKPCIIIGTQDMLLSCALNRGYTMSRYRWPMHFGLLNNDCLWVMDEVQLMGPGLAAACQLEAFRLGDDGGSVARFDSYPAGRSITWYASATADQSHLQTRDWSGTKRPPNFFLGLSETEESARSGTVAERRLATKRLELRRKSNFGDRKNLPSSELMDAIVIKHKQMVGDLRGTPSELPRRTLIICNTVDRAIAVRDGIEKSLTNAEEVDLLLMHSRFRSRERECQADRLASSATTSGGQIVIATQVIEAGVDVSSAILWTEIAPLVCLVQRLGRLNRKGEFGYDRHAPNGHTPTAIVLGIEAPDPESREFRNNEQRQKARKEAERKHMPYEKAKCDDAWTSLDGLKDDASPASLSEISEAVAESIDRSPYSLQRHELLDFFDTDANLSLGLTDVSAFVRGLDADTDLYVAWRDWPGSDDGGEPRFSPDFQRQELCPVSIGRAAESRAVLSNGWLWRGKDAGWVSVEGIDIVPGMTVLLPTSAGGYDPDLGWTGSTDGKPVASVYQPSDTPSDEEMLSSLNHGWRSITQHTDEVESEWKMILTSIAEAGLSPAEQSAVLRGVHWHDVGKNHVTLALRG